MDLDDLRRNAYVRAVIRASESDDVIGFIGPNVPVELFEAAGLMAVPVYGLDREILNYSCETNLCPLIDATITYAKTDKCPLIHSAKMIVADDTCVPMSEALSRLEGKRIHIYAGNTAGLIEALREVYGTGEILPESLESVREERRRILTRIADLTNDPIEAFTVEYYINFLDLSERMSFLDGLQEIYTSGELIETIYRCPECRGSFEGGFNYGRLS